MGDMGTDRTEGQTFDFIICGGGTTGCVIAGRLAEDPNLSVLVIEAGPDSANLENVHMPGGWNKNFDSETDWNIVSEPMPGADGRRIPCSRGRMLGGSSGVNGTLCVRGMKKDFDDWGLEGWSGKDMWRNIKKSESFHGKDWFKAGTDDHGYAGPMHTEPHDLAPISKLVMESMIEKGLPLDEDMFSSGETAVGCGHSLRTVHQGARAMAAEYVIKKARNLTIWTDVTVNKIVLSNTLQATGVEVVSKSGLVGTIYCTKEVIVSGGAYGSPAILLRSGIGPRGELEQLGIPVKKDLSGVGKNLQDHPIMRMFYEAGPDGLTNDSLVYHNDALAASLALYKKDKSGFFSTFPFGTFAFARVDEVLSGHPLWKIESDGRDPMGLTKEQPNFEIFNSELYGHTKDVIDFPMNGEHAFGVFVVLFSGRSRGSVTLKSTDPFASPTVDHNYLADPLDLLVMTAGCHMANDIIMEGKATKEVTKGSWPRTSNHHAFRSVDEWIPMTKQITTTCYHPGGTCKMGREEDAMAVLDEKLRVRGIRGLRVADVSIMPELNNGHTQVPAYGIGERAVELIREDL